MTESRFLRVPEARFANLPGFPYRPHYVSLSCCAPFRMAYIDESTPGFNPHSSEKARTFICLHGVPTYSYLYRKIIPILLKSNEHHSRGVRVICPDFIGWGRSDKPTELNESNPSTKVHYIEYHRQSIIALIKYLKVRDFTLIVQDWGGSIGLTIPMYFDVHENNHSKNSSITNTSKRTPTKPEPRCTRVFFFNTGLSVGGGGAISRGFLQWRQYSSENYQTMRVSRMMKMMCAWLTPAECAAYDAPFPDRRYQLAIGRWPSMVPLHFGDDGTDLMRRATFWWRRENTGHCKVQVYQAHGLMDNVITKRAALAMHKVFFRAPYKQTNAFPKPILWIPNGAHFVQESPNIEWIVHKALKYFGDIPYALVEYEWIATTQTRVPSKTKTKTKTKRQSKSNSNSNATQTEDDRCHILQITLNAPPMHVLSPRLVSELTRILRQCNDASTIEGRCTRGMILTANTQPRLRSGRTPIFCPGLDLRVVASADASVIRAYLADIGRLFDAFNASMKPIVCALNGSAIAGGALLAVLCDYRVAYPVSAMVQMSEGRDAMVVSGSARAMVARVTGSADQTAFVLQTAVPFRGARAMQYGLVNELCSVDGDAHELLHRCIRVLEEDYFYAQMHASGVMRVNERKIALAAVDPDAETESSEAALEMFMSPKVQQYIHGMVSNKKKKKKSETRNTNAIMPSKL